MVGDHNEKFLSNSSKLLELMCLLFSFNLKVTTVDHISVSKMSLIWTDNIQRNKSSLDYALNIIDILPQWTDDRNENLF